LSHGRRDWEYNRSIEFILLAVKGTPALAVENPSICFSCPIVPPARMIHPNEKPPQVIKNILNHCSFEGSLILDPFAGSGVVLSTCAEMGRHYVGIEREKKYYDGILRRLKNEDND
jgi:site-specific DNA-methyltransferase (adenine-specific)